MIPKDVLKNIRRIQITTSRLVSDVFAGQYHSVFKGRGIEFDEVREYLPGDEIRSIDWNVTARMGHPFVKKFVEERELTVVLMVDVSASSRFGTVRQLKSRIAAEICSLLAFSAVRNNDKAGLVLFTDRIEKFVPPRKGLRHVLRVVREVLYFKPQGRGTDIAGALEYVSRVLTRRAVVFLISDFYAPDFRKTLRLTNKRHDVVAITITDPREREMPAVGIVTLDDPETGASASVDTSDTRFRRMYESAAASRARERAEVFRSAKVDSIELSTAQPYAQSLITFFRKRQRRMR
jgi:uncharacterized protein (DUF58 family)